MIGLLVLILAALSLANAQICPPAEVLRPCACFESSLIIQCYHIREQFDLKGILDNASQFVNDDVVFRTLIITGTYLVEIVEGAVEHLKFDYVDISWNQHLEYISPRAFNATRNVTMRGVDFSYNNFRNESNIFEVINSFQRLRQVYIENNGITSIPDNAFQNHPFLERVSLSSNNISRIGSRAFATGSENLFSLQLTVNSIPSESLSPDAFDEMGYVVVYLDCNSMEFMEQKSFQTMMDRARQVNVGYGCPGEGPVYRRLVCDERADWICDGEDIYRPKLSGYLCKEGSGFEDIWEYCAGRNRTPLGIH